MEKIFKYFPKAAQAAVSFQSPTFSPARDRRFDANDHNHNHNRKNRLTRNFSSPVMSIIPREVRGKKSNNYETQEPTSPKISCIGQIKHTNKSCKIPRELKPDKTRPVKTKPDMKRQQSTIKKIFSSRRKSDASSADRNNNKLSVSERAPKLCQVRRFASSRDTLAGFDWTTVQVAPTSKDDLMVPVGAAIDMEFEPRKEINLWKRRTMCQPKPLELNMVRTR